MKFLTALIFMLATNIAAAQKTVEIVWPFNPGSSQANVIRATIENANKDQSKYTFVFVNKPGAGGAIAVNYLNNNENLNHIKVLSHTSSFWIRPMFFEEGKYDINSIVPLTFVYREESIALVSAKYKTLDELRKESNPNVGVIPGSVTNLVARKISTESKQDYNFIPYAGTPEITRDILGNHLSAGIEFTAAADALKGKVNVLGITGTREVLGYKTFASLGIPGLENVFNVLFFGMQRSSDPAIVKELSDVLIKASNRDNVKQVIDIMVRARAVSSSFEDSQQFFKNHSLTWSSIVKK